jgi:vacuolar iron transporter family protein
LTVTQSAGTPPADSSSGQNQRTGIARREPRPHTDRSGALRAGVFGASDGLVSSSALVMGVAGSGSAHRVILLSGVAGLLAGSLSMAAGEFVSMASQREMYQREIMLERQELEKDPQKKRNELLLLYQAKGLERADAARLTDRIMADPQVALDTLVREKLGLDPTELGSPLAAAITSKLTFTAGALVAILAYVIGDGTAAFIGTIGLVAAALVGIGAGVGKLNGRSIVSSGLRQLLLGGAAAVVTFCVGHVIGASVS